jgi:hypothetical protein
MVRVHSPEQEKLWGILVEVAGGNSGLVLEALRHGGRWRPWGRAVPTIQDLLFYIVDHPRAGVHPQPRGPIMADVHEPVREWFTAADSELKVCPFCYTSALEGETQCTRCHAEPAEPGSRGLYSQRAAASALPDEPSAAVHKAATVP